MDFIDNPYTRALQMRQQMLGEALPQTPVVDPNTAQMLAPKTGGLFDPVTQLFVGQKQQRAQQEQLNFEREKYKTEQTRKQAQTQSAINSVDSAFHKPGSSQARYLEERYGPNKEAIKDMIRTGVLNPLEMTKGFGQWHAKDKGLQRRLNVVRNLYDKYKNSPVFTMTGADKLNVENLSKSEEGIQVLTDQLNAMRELQKKLITKQAKEGIVYKYGDKFIRFKTNGDIVEIKNPPDPSRIVDISELVTGRTGSEMPLEQNIEAAMKQTFAPRLWVANRDNKQAQTVLQSAIQKQAEQLGVPLSEEDMKRTMAEAHNIIMNAQQPMSAEQIAAKALPIKSVQVPGAIPGIIPDRVAQIVMPKEGEVFAKDGKTTVSVTSPEGQETVRVYARAHNIPESNIFKALTNPVTAAHIAKQIAEWQTQADPSVMAQMYEGLPPPPAVRVINEIRSLVDRATGASKVSP